ncbi:hypothetical protein MUA83_14020 (plasmid) [Staphylococcus aureus]|uniref:hypothetical protein n=1 Tax=Staphylococcus aureus TaxID=1280 RepID=UPI0021D34C4A|nr:hypothetical protein [Staphylococcus aureus]UXT47685.1 hypothetical protein MUA83_14020 [Staphylococcus aureus]
MRNIYNYDDSKILKLDSNLLQDNFEQVDNIFKNFECITPSFEVINENIALKLNGVFISTIHEDIDISKITNLYIDEEYYFSYNELVIKYTERQSFT